ncbi:MAG: kynureninase [Gammaproteobacteria bacterium]|nr:kynureninase [Gammaproteobacteria bacterium]
MTPEQISKLDAGDEFADKRHLFSLPEDIIYLNGNSLGPLPIRAAQRLDQVTNQQWGEDLISSWNKHSWIDLPVTAGEKIAPLLGAASGQVICCDSISLNLFKLLAGSLQLRPDRFRVLSQTDNFPTDLYVAQGLQQLLGTSRCQLDMVAPDQLCDALSKEVAVLLLSHVNFRDGYIHDMAEMTRLAHQQGALVIWDLAHSAGVLPLELDEWNVDFAVGCGYKFLNGGPGAPAFIYVNSRHHGKFSQPLLGWMGHKAPFDFDTDFLPAEGVGQFMTGTPPILSLVALDAALDTFADIDLHKLREKSIALTECFLQLVEKQPALADLQLRSPRKVERRGSQLSFAHPEAYGICRAWADAGVIADFRSPDLFRIGFSPLILSFEEIAQAVHALAEVMRNKTYAEAKYQQRLKVT